MLFEQTQNIVGRIQQILREYPYGDAVLLELLQNADDAGASACHMNLACPSSLSSKDHNQLARSCQEDVVRSLVRPPPPPLLPQPPSEDLVRAVMSQLCWPDQPVLEFYNNSVFTEKDLSNIQSIGGSIKDSKQHDGTKVGRFGLGFNSAYHISDVIAFVSVNALVVFDPSRSFLPPDKAGGARGGGYRWDFVAESDKLEKMIVAGRIAELSDKDWFFLCLVRMFEENTEAAVLSTVAPDSAAAASSAGACSNSDAPQFSKRKPYRGTLFRFPLRSKPSTLWREVHSIDSIATLMTRFPRAAATLGLVLAKNVARISASLTIEPVRTAKTDTTTTSSPKEVRGGRIPLYDLVSSAGNSDSVKQTKAKCLRWLGEYTQVMQRVAKLADDGNLSETKSRDQRKSLPKPEKYHVELSIRLAQSDVCTHAIAHPSLPFSERFKISSSSGRTTTTSSSSLTLIEQFTKSFNASHQFGPGGEGGWDGSQVWAIAEECARYHHPISVPWSATIVENHRSLLPPPSSSSLSSGGGSEGSSSSSSGTLMCFFPIRASTGLPVHIHGYFQLSSDRQSVASVDKSRWNHALCSEVVPHGYAAAIHSFCTPTAVSNESPMRLWPLGVFSDDVTVELIASRTMATLSTMAVFPCRGALRVAPPNGTSSVTTTTTTTLDAYPTHDTLLFPWTMRYEKMDTVRCLGPLPTPHGGSSTSTSAAVGGGGGDRAATSAGKDRRVPASDLTPEAYFFLLSVLPLAGQLLYVTNELEFKHLLPQVADAFHRRRIHTASVDPAFLRGALSSAYRDAVAKGTTVASKLHPAKKGVVSEELDTLHRIPNHVSLVLMCACLRDGELEMFVNLSNRSEIPPLVPLATGLSGFLRRPSPGGGDSNKQVALMCTERSWYDLAQGLPLRDRLIVYLEEEEVGSPSTLLESGSSAATSGQQRELSTDVVVLPSCCNDNNNNNKGGDSDGGARRRVVVPRHLVEAARRYFIHLRFSEVVDVLDSTTFASKLGALLRASSVTTFIRDPSSSRSGRGGAASSLSSGLPEEGRGEGGWEMELNSFRVSSNTVALLVKTLTTSYQATSEYFSLPILPAVMHRPTTGDDVPPATPERRYCVSAMDGVCIAMGGVITGDAESQEGRHLAALRDVLVELGATAIDSSIFPATLLQQWSDGSSYLAPTCTGKSTASGGSASSQGRLTRVAVLDSTPQGARCAVASLRALINGRPLSLLFPLPSSSSLVPSASDETAKSRSLLYGSVVGSGTVTRADALRCFFSRFKDDLTMADTLFLSTLPIFRTIWGTYVALRDDGVEAGERTKATQQHGGVDNSSSSHVFMLPKGLPAIAEQALRAAGGPWSAEKGTIWSTVTAPDDISVRLLRSLAIIDRYEEKTEADTKPNRDDGPLLSAAFSLRELPLDVALTLAATRVAPLHACISNEEVEAGAINDLKSSIANFWATLFEQLHHSATTAMGPGPSTTSLSSDSSRQSVALQSMDKHLAAALRWLARCPIFLRSSPPCPHGSDDGLSAVMSFDQQRRLLQTSHVPPCRVIDDESLPRALVDLLNLVERQSASLAAGSRCSSSSSSAATAVVPVVAQNLRDEGTLPAKLRKSVLSLLGVPSSVDGESLFALANSAAQFFSSREHGCTGSDASVTTLSVVDCAAAVLTQLEAATEITEEQWRLLGHLALVPTAATPTTSPSVFAPLNRVCLPHVYRLCPTGRRQCLHPTLVGGSGTKGELRKLAHRYEWSMPPPLADVLMLIESIGKRCASHHLLVDCDLVGSDEDEQTTSTATATASESNAADIPGSTIDARDWSTMLDHVEQQLRVYLEKVPDDSSIWITQEHNHPLRGQRIDNNLSREVARQQHASGTTAPRRFPLIPSTATTGLTNFMDPLLSSGEQFLELVRSSFERVYFPERRAPAGWSTSKRSVTTSGGIAYPVAHLAFHPQADGCAPFLATIDKATATRYAALWCVLGVREKHTAQELFNVLDNILFQARMAQECQAKSLSPSSNAHHVDPMVGCPPPPLQSSSPKPEPTPKGSFVGTRLDDKFRSAYASVLVYLTEVYPNEARECNRTEHKLLVPTADGLVNWGHLVNYNVITTASTPQHGDSPASSFEQHTLLHAAVRTDVAKVLGMHHTGIQLVAQMHAKHSRGGAFRAKGQRQSVVNAIKRILGDYSDQQSVLMEMIQNADDAGASVITFHLDHRQHSSVTTDELLGKEMRRCQGPSLVVTNDKLFTPSDFDALFEIGCGHKTRDQLSIGRFGVGFNAVYHVTDCPSIVSGDCTLFLDPAAVHLDSATAEAPGVMINHTKEPSLAAMFPGQLAPYRRYDVDFTKHFPGTLFRLPLRLEPWEHSMSPSAWTTVDMRRVFQNFIPFMPHILLFLKSIEQIRFTEICVVEGNPNGREVELASVRLRDIVVAPTMPHHDAHRAHPTPSERLDGIRDYRSQVVSFAATQHPEKPIGRPLHAFCITEAVVNIPPLGRTTSYPWLLSTTIRSIASGPELPSCNSELRRKLIPWGSVAVSLKSGPRIDIATMPTSQDDDEVLSEALTHSRAELAHLGQSFCRTPQSMVHCYLPLPSLKGELPFHVHGCFALTSDRRGMWTQSLSDDASWEVTWNRHILSEVIADAAVHALRCHPGGLGSSAERKQQGGIVALPALSEYYDVFPATAGGGYYVTGTSGGAASSGVADPQHTHTVMTPSSSTTEVFRNLRSGFFQQIHRTSAAVFWCTQGWFVESHRACCAPYRPAQSSAAAGSGGLIAATPPRGAGEDGSSRGGSVPSSMLPFQLSECLVDHVLVDERLCYMPQDVFHALVAASDEMCLDPPSELNPRKIAKELFQRAGSAQGIAVVFASLLTHCSADAAAATSTTPAAAAPSPQQKPPAAKRMSFFGRSSSSSASSAAPTTTHADDIKGSSPLPPPFVAMAELTLYLSQLSDPALLQGVPLVLLRDGTVGIVGKVVHPDGGLPHPEGAAAAAAPTASSMFIAPEFAKEVEQMFPLVPVVDDRYFHAVVSLASKKAQEQQQHARTMQRGGGGGGRSTTQQQQHDMIALLVDAFTQERWSMLLGVEPLHVKTISKLFHLHATAQTGIDMPLGRAYFLDRTFTGSGSLLRRWCSAFWHFVRKSDSSVRFDAAFLQQCGDLAEWPLVPARRAGEHVLVPMKECGLLVCGSTGALVNEALEHLGVWALDPEFDECQTIRTKCGVVDIEGQKIGDLLENAVAQGRFVNMPDEHRERMLVWLLQCNRSQRGFFQTFLGGTGPLVDSIRKLPLFPQYNGTLRAYKYAAITDATAATNNGAAFAVPPDAPLSPLCHGLFKEAVPELDLTALPMPVFLSSKVHPAMLRLEGRLLQGGALTTSEELAHWALISRHITPSLVEQFRSSAFVPRQLSLAEVRANRLDRLMRDGKNGAATQSLRSLAAEWLADSYVAATAAAILPQSQGPRATRGDVVASAKLEEKHPTLYALIRAARMDYLDRRSRLPPVSIVRPCACPGAPFPHVLSLLMQFMPQSFTKMVCPLVLWDDVAIQQLLVQLGVSHQLDATVLKEAAEAFAAIVPQVSAHSVRQLNAFLEAATQHSIVTDAVVKEPPGKRRIRELRDLSWSVALCVLNLGGGGGGSSTASVSSSAASNRHSCVDAVSNVAFLVPHPLPFLPKKCEDESSSKKLRTSCIDLVAPADCASFSYRYAVWLQRPILPAGLTALSPGKPPVADILAQLVALLSPSPPVALTANVFNRVLSSTYSILSTEYRTELSSREVLGDGRHTTVCPNELLRSNPLFVVPVDASPIVQASANSEVANSALQQQQQQHDDDDDDDGNAGTVLNTFDHHSSPSTVVTPIKTYLFSLEHRSPSQVSPPHDFDVEDDDLPSQHPLAEATATQRSRRLTAGPHCFKARLSQIVNVGYGSNIGSLRPHFFHLHEFDLCPPLASLIHVVSSAGGGGASNAAAAIGVPSVDAVMCALDTYAMDITPLSSERLRTYTELLKLLVFAADHHRAILSPEVAPHIPFTDTQVRSDGAVPNARRGGVGQSDASLVKPKPIRVAGQPPSPPHTLPPRPKQHHSSSNASSSIHGGVTSTAGVRIPDQKGVLTFLSQGISIPDQPSLIRRILPGSVPLVHSLVPQYVARALGAPSIGRILQEEPRGDVSSSSRSVRQRRQQQKEEQEKKQRTSSSTCRKERDLCAIAGRYRAFFASPLFLRVVQRLLLTAAASQQSFGDTHRYRHGGETAASNQQQQLRASSITQQEQRSLENLSVEFVDAISLFISHEKQPDVNIANGTESPPFALSSTLSTVFVVVSCDNSAARRPATTSPPRTTTATTTTTTAPHYYLVAMGINRLLRNRLGPVLAALSCVLECVTEGAHGNVGGGTTQTSNVGAAVHALLDTFDCSDIMLSPAAASASHSSAPFPPAQTQWEGELHPLERYERRMGRLLNASRNAMLSVTDGHVVDDYWLLKYAVTSTTTTHCIDNVLFAGTVAGMTPPFAITTGSGGGASGGLFLWKNVGVEQLSDTRVGNAHDDERCVALAFR